MKMAESPVISRLSAIERPYQICQSHGNCSYWLGPFKLVEAGRVELPSESTSTGTSPSADDPFHSLTQAWVVTLLSLVES